MIQLQNVTKRIKENTVLDNVSYTFKKWFCLWFIWAKWFRKDYAAKSYKWFDKSG